MKVLLKRDYTWEDEDGVKKTIGSGTVIEGARAEGALSEGAGEQIPDNQPNFNPLPGQGVAAAPFNVNEQPFDPVADQYVGQGTAEETTGTTEAGTKPDPESPVMKGETARQQGTAPTDEQIRDRRTALEKQISETQNEDEKKALQSQLDQLMNSARKAAPANKARTAPANKGK